MPSVNEVQTISDARVRALIRQTLEDFTLTQQQLADHLGVARNTIVRHVNELSARIENPVMWELALYGLRIRLQQQTKTPRRRAHA
jgi:DNA-binding XRE family transcriptional regulator